MKTQIFKSLFKAATLSLLISSSMPSFAEPTDEIIAIVGNSAILRSDLNQAVNEVKQTYQAQKKEVPPEQYLKMQALDAIIIRDAQLEQVKRYGVKIDEATLNDAVLKVAKQSGSNSLESFQQKLDAYSPGAYAGLRDRVAEDLSVQKLRQQMVMSRIKISDQDVDNFLKSPQGQAAVGSQAHILHMRIAGSGSEAEINQTATNVKNALQDSNDTAAIAKKFSTANVTVDGADMGFRSFSDIPAELAARVTNIKVGQTSELIPAKDGIHILKLLDRKSNDQKALVHQYQVRHILIQPSEVVTADMAKQMIDSIYSRLSKGEDFATLAATYSNDPGSARDGGSLGWVSPGTMVPEFEQQMKDTPVNQISQPFQSQFGWHILQVTDTRDQDMTSELQKRMAKQILGERQFDSELDSWLRELRASTYVDIKDKSLDQKAIEKAQNDSTQEAEQK
ncbi:peptidylprolyl isomerase [Acinetobacter gerneri]|jgi:peptidyl-prolyl cis-trans isomerase SurA|uniref:Chaperone SurA n=1 Tax=Acinetobacter gerneri TaxID=202952 RepID=A0AAW8JMH1_9GAMM|nr:peptidylprolyl isomerase [Acinetobacter gerneri]MCH4245136.1 peptidylprolyl isomerase [Acinetobacter gerneri]MDQ9011321.1 peptidylprolyl isomerase [Acinetobacter gerneri]MDQ9015457.1 peptidylprolyl isomerase [Acinetobacter gerneri]MDQ9026639.1 peptidylprolyl isomerase [Acinetobacter gerneri]MDQ9053909.1 peptidylprolyl isomerase [Acinetobacter gerneri]